MNAVATPTRAKASSRKAALPKAVAATEASDRSPARIEAAFGSVELLLTHAHATEEVHDWSGDSNRLLRIAHELADEASICPPTGIDVDSAAFDIAALIRAARLVPGDSESPERKALLDKAAVQLDWLTESSGCCDPGVPRPALAEAKPPSIQRQDANESTTTSEAPYSIPAWRAVISEVGGIHQAAQHILAAQIDYMDSSAAFGVLALVERLSQLVDGAYNEAEESLSDHVSGYFSRLSDEYLIVVDVASAVNRDGLEDLTLWAVIHLLNGCRRLVDDHVDSLMEAFQAGKAGGADHA